MELLENEFLEDILQPKCNGAQSSDQILLQGIFPVEIWLQVLKRSNDKDLEVILQSSVFFREILNETRTQFLFGSVLKCLLPTLPNSKNAGRFLGKCRETCQQWNQGVESMLTKKSHLEHTCIDSGMDTTNWPAYRKYFLTKFPQYGRDDLPGKFIGQFYETHHEYRKNPFVDRSIEIRFFSKELERLMDTWGRGIWYCHLYISVYDPDESYPIPWRILRKLSGLKSLTVEVDQPANAAWFPHRIPPLPTFPHLECLKVYGAGSEFIFEALLKNNRHVKSLVRASARRSTPGFLTEMPMPNLLQLNTTFQTPEGFFLLEKNNEVNWPLRKLVLDFYTMKEVMRWKDLARSFEILGTTFGQTLKELHFHFPYVCGRYERYSLNLPNLTCLTLELKFLLPLDFILPMKDNLRSLHIRLECDWNSELIAEESDIKFFTTRDNLNESNLWQLFPRLQKITYQHQFDHGEERLETTRTAVTKI